MARRWTPPELEILARDYATTLTDELASRLGRSPCVVHKKAREMGLSKDKAFLSAHKSKVVKQRSPWTPEIEEIVALLYPHCPTRVLVELLEYPAVSINEKARRMGLEKTKEALSAMQYERMANNPEAYAAARIKPGDTPWNKGLKGVTTGGKATQFKKGHMPSTWVPVGTERWKAANPKRGNHPYLSRKVAEPNVWRPVHYIIWEEKHGPVPKGHVLRFKDQDHRNLSPDNLELLTRGQNSAKNTPWATMPRELAELCTLKGVLKRSIKKAQEKLA